MRHFICVTAAAHNTYLNADSIVAIPAISSPQYEDERDFKNSETLSIDLRYHPLIPACNALYRFLLNIVAMCFT